MPENGEPKSKRLRAVLLFLLLLSPSAWFAWRNRHMPQFGQGHDDAIYYTVSKSLVQGTGYRILNLPSTPFETKYPPILPWLLTLPWIINPRFPDNLPLATALQWAPVPPLLWLCLRWFRRAKFSAAQTWALSALVIAGPYTVLFGAGIYTEILYSVFLLTSLLMLDKCMKRGGAWQWAAGAGVLAGVGYLTRTAGVVSIVAFPGILLLRRKPRAAIAFAVAMAPAVAGWTLWTRAHHTAATNLSLLYNTDYLGFEFFNVHPGDLLLVMWKNLGEMLYAIGGVALPFETPVRFAVAAIILRGIARKWRDPFAQLYLAFAALTMMELLVWHFPPNLRLMYPLLPLFAAGLFWEGENLLRQIGKNLQDQDAAQRAAAFVLTGFAAAFIVWSAWMNLEMVFRRLPAMARQNERMQQDQRRAYEWISQHLSAGCSVLAFNPALYLHTARHTASLIIPTIFWYRGDRNATLEFIRDLPAYAAQNGLQYAYLHQADYELLAPGNRRSRAGGG